MNVNDVEVCVKHLVSGFMAPEVVEEVARDEWFDAAQQEEVTLRYNPKTHMVNASYHKKATKNPHH